MEPFATREQYDARFPGRDASDEMLDECLADATAAILAAIDARNPAASTPADFADRCMRVCRSVANRILPSGTAAQPGVTQLTMSAGPYSETLSYTPSYGTPKLLASELALLGLSGARVGWAGTGAGDD